MKGDVLPIALLNEDYVYNFEVHEGWADFWDSSTSTELYGGNLPSGVGISSNGLLFGTPRELGAFDFRVLVQDNDFLEDDSWPDAEWFTFFVTEASTNEDCPRPNDETTTEIYLCLGDIEAGTVVMGDEFNLDVNYFVNLDSAGDYDIITLSFTIVYDPAAFGIDSDSLTSSLLREAVRADATVAFDSSTAGQLGIVISNSARPFTRAGRILDIPFSALLDLDQEEYPFTLTINAITPEQEETTLPETLAIDGSLTVEEPAGTETEDIEK